MPSNALRIEKQFDPFIKKRAGKYLRLMLHNTLMTRGFKKCRNWNLSGILHKMRRVLIGEYSTKLLYRKLPPGIVHSMVKERGSIKAPAPRNHFQNAGEKNSGKEKGANTFAFCPTFFKILKK